MRGEWLAIAGAALALSAPAPSSAGEGADALESSLVAMERQSWVAWKAHDAGFFERFLSDDHVEVGGAGPTGKADVVNVVGGGACTVDAYSVDHFAYRRLGPDTAVLTYRAEQTTHCGAATVPSPVWATSVYVRKAGRWRNAIYVHSLAPSR